MLSYPLNNFFKKIKIINTLSGSMSEPLRFRHSLSANKWSPGVASEGLFSYVRSMYSTILVIKKILDFSILYVRFLHGIRKLKIFRSIMYKIQKSRQSQYQLQWPLLPTPSQPPRFTVLLHLVPLSSSQQIILYKEHKYLNWFKRQY